MMTQQRERSTMDQPADPSDSADAEPTPPFQHTARGDYSNIWGHLKDVGFNILATEDFIVYLDLNGKIEWETTPAYDAREEVKAPKRKQAHDALMSRYIVVDAAPVDGLSTTEVQKFRHQIGAAIASSLEGNHKAADSMLTAAEAYFQKRSEETSRNWYLTASFWAALPVVGAGFLLWMLRGQAVDLLGTGAFWLILCGCAGAGGALFSVITRSGKLKFESSAGRPLHKLEATSRIAAGVISGFLAALAVQTGIIFSPLTAGGRLHLTMMLVAVAAGAGERLATSIISKFDSPQAKTPNASQGAKGARQ